MSARRAHAPGYYVSALDGARHAMPEGPFATHEEALARVEPCRRLWEERDPRAIFAAWGTCRVRE